MQRLDSVWIDQKTNKPYFKILIENQKSVTKLTFLMGDFNFVESPFSRDLQ